MKKIQSKKHRQLKADQTVHPPVNREDGTSPTRKNKKRKKIYQNGLWVDDLDINDVVE
jgi:hypothetical protein